MHHTQNIVNWILRQKTWLFFVQVCQSTEKNNYIIIKSKLQVDNLQKNAGLLTLTTMFEGCPPVMWDFFWSTGGILAVRSYNPDVTNVSHSS